MIQSTSHTDPAERAKALAAAEVHSAVPMPVKRDRLSTASVDHLRAVLRDEPEVRPEAVERGRTLAADPAYPSPEIVKRISVQILNAPDPAEDPS
jgi:hypothetical protein